MTAHKSILWIIFTFFYLISYAQNADTSQISFRYLEFTKLNGKKSHIGKNTDIVIFNFWHVSCAPCIWEIDRLNELVEKYRGSNIIFLGMYVAGSEEIVSKFLKRRSFSYQILKPHKIFLLHHHVKFYPTNMIFWKGVKVYQSEGYTEELFKIFEEKVSFYSSQTKKSP
jgi:thiol-disulfide isomerase/thioredoxin